MSAKRTLSVVAPALTPSERTVVRKVIVRTRSEDYDGHTEFERMSPAERLDWLGAAAKFIVGSKHNIKGGAAAHAKARSTAD